MRYATGKAPARPNAVQFELSHYLPLLPIPPHSFGHEMLVPEWPMLANDRIGDCVVAGALHATQLWNAEARHPVTVDDAAAIATYSGATGYDPAQDVTEPDGTVSNPTDQGTDLELFARYWRRTGVLDAAGQRHKLGAYLALRPHDTQQLWTALYLFGAVMIGLQLPDTAEDQFEAGHVLDYEPGASSVGGHCVLAVARRGFVGIVTWGQLALCTPRFLQAYCDEAFVGLSHDALRGGVSIDGFDLAQLTRDLQALDQEH